MAHCDSRFNPPIFDVGRELPYLFMTRLSEKGAAEVRGRFDVRNGHTGRLSWGQGMRA